MYDEVIALVIQVFPTNKWNGGKCIDFKCVQKPTESDLV